MELRYQYEYRAAIELNGMAITLQELGAHQLAFKTFRDSIHLLRDVQSMLPRCSSETSLPTGTSLATVALFTPIQVEEILVKASRSLAQWCSRPRRTAKIPLKIKRIDDSSSEAASFYLSTQAKGPLLTAVFFDLTEIASLADRKMDLDVARLMHNCGLAHLIESCTIQKTREREIHRLRQHALRLLRSARTILVTHGATTMADDLELQRLCTISAVLICSMIQVLILSGDYQPVMVVRLVNVLNHHLGALQLHHLYLGQKGFSSEISAAAMA